MKNTKRLLFIFGLISFYSMESHAWGLRAHRTIGEIAQEHLSVESAKRIQILLGNENLADASIWADTIRSSDKLEYQKFLPWHYATVPVGSRYDQLPEKEEGDIYLAITRIFAELTKLKDNKLTNTKKIKDAMKIKLRLLIHFVGDIHQPLHIGNGEDLGGNLCMVKYFGRKTSLHAVWDSLMVKQLDFSYTEFSSYLIRNQKNLIRKKDKWNILEVKKWLEESNTLRPTIYPESPTGKKHSYCFKNFDIYNQMKDDKNLNAGIPKLSYAYNFKFNKIVKERVYLGGVRLARMLNKLFSK